MGKLMEEKFTTRLLNLCELLSYTTSCTVSFPAVGRITVHLQREPAISKFCLMHHSSLWRRVSVCFRFSAYLFHAAHIIINVCPIPLFHRMKSHNLFSHSLHRSFSRSLIILIELSVSFQGLLYFFRD